MGDGITRISLSSRLSRLIGMKTCWVLTGSQKDRRVLKKMPEKYNPDYILESVVNIPS